MNDLTLDSSLPQLPTPSFGDSIELPKCSAHTPLPVEVNLKKFDSHASESSKLDQFEQARLAFFSRR